MMGGLFSSVCAGMIYDWRRKRYQGKFFIEKKNNNKKLVYVIKGQKEIYFNFFLLQKISLRCFK